MCTSKRITTKNQIDVQRSDWKGKKRFVQGLEAVVKKTLRCYLLYAEFSCFSLLISLVLSVFLSWRSIVSSIRSSATIIHSLFELYIHAPKSIHPRITYDPLIVVPKRARAHTHTKTHSCMRIQSYDIYCRRNECTKVVASQRFLNNSICNGCTYVLEKNNLKLHWNFVLVSRVRNI